MTTLAVTGATGHVGGLVARQLSDLRPRLIVRDAVRAPEVEGATVAQASYGDLETSLAALEDVDVLLMVSAAESADRRDQHRTFIRAAVGAGVAHVVYTSFAGAAPDAVFTLARDHFDAEQAIRESGMGFTFLRDSFYLDLLPLMGGEEGVIRGPAGDGLVAGVARADIAEVAATVLRDPAAHRGATYELTGPEALTFAEIAARASAVLGRPIRFEDETEEEAYASRRAAYDVEDWQLDAWVSTYLAVRAGELAHLSDDVRRLTGHGPTSLEDALRDQA